MEADKLGYIERVEPLIDKDALNEILAQQRIILEMHAEIVKALAKPAFIYREPEYSKGTDH